MLVQLTVLLPLAFIGIMKLTRDRWRIAGGAFALLAAGSFAAAWYRGPLGQRRRRLLRHPHPRLRLLVGVVLAYAVLSPQVRRAVGSPARCAVRYGTPAALVALLWLWSSTGCTAPASSAASPR